MKKIIFLACMGFSLNAFAQSPFNAAQLKPKTYKYAEVEVSDKGLTNSFKMAIDTGQKQSTWGIQSLKDSLGKTVCIPSEIDAINYMANHGWEFVNGSESRYNYYLFFRKKISG